MKRMQPSWVKGASFLELLVFSGMEHRALMMLLLLVTGTVRVTCRGESHPDQWKSSCNIPVFTGDTAPFPSWRCLKRRVVPSSKMRNGVNFEESTLPLSFSRPSNPQFFNALLKQLVQRTISLISWHVFRVRIARNNLQLPASVAALMETERGEEAVLGERERQFLFDVIHEAHLGAGRNQRASLARSVLRTSRAAGASGGTAGTSNRSGPSKPLPPTVTLLDVLRAFDHVVKVQKPHVPDCNLMYSCLLKMSLSPAQDWWEKLDHLRKVRQNRGDGCCKESVSTRALLFLCFLHPVLFTESKLGIICCIKV
jgi:hypothetical protein